MILPNGEKKEARQWLGQCRQPPASRFINQMRSCRAGILRIVMSYLLPSIDRVHTLSSRGAQGRTVKLDVAHDDDDGTVGWRRGRFDPGRHQCAAEEQAKARPLSVSPCVHRRTPERRRLLRYPRVVPRRIGGPRRSASLRSFAASHRSAGPCRCADPRPSVLRLSFVFQLRPLPFSPGALPGYPAVVKGW